MNGAKNVAQSGGLTSETSDRVTIFDLFGVYLQLVLAFVGVTFLIQVIHGGYIWMTAAGNEESIKHAQAKIVNGAIGVVVIFMAFILTYFLVYQFGTEAGVTIGAPTP